MALSIRNRKAEQLAREVAAQTGETMTVAVIHALEDRLQRLTGRRVAPGPGCRDPGGVPPLPRSAGPGRAFCR